MSAVDELVPLHTDFDLVWRGCDRAQVQQYVERVESELRLLTMDRDGAVRRADALAEQLTAARAEVRELSERLDRLCRTPIDAASLTDRLRRMVELAHAEAEEITGRAHAAAQQERATASQTADRLRRRAEYLMADLDRRRAEMEAEHRELMAHAHERVATLTREAERRRRELDDQAAQVRGQIQSDFELATAARREETTRELAAARATASAEAERVVRTARERAARMIAEAQEQVDRLHAHRDRVAAGLRAAQRTLAAAGPLLTPQPDEGELAGETALPEKLALPVEGAVSRNAALSGRAPEEEAASSREEPDTRDMAA